MSASIIIGTGNVWSIASRYFDYYLDKIRAGYPPELDPEEAEIFRPFEEASDFITVEHLPKNRYRYFVNIVEQEYDKSLNDPRENTEAFRGTAMTWKELVDQLHQDPRYCA